MHCYEPVRSDKFVIFPYKRDDDLATLYTEQKLESKYPLGYAYLKQCESTLRGREKGTI